MEQERSAARARVFVSYSHDEPSTCEFVRKVTRQLKEWGFKVFWDEERKGTQCAWAVWIEKKFRKADSIVIIPDRFYLDKWNDEHQKGGNGVRCEAYHIRQLLYQDGSKQITKSYHMVCDKEDSSQWIPHPLAGYPYYNLSDKRSYPKLRLALGGVRPVDKEETLEMERQKRIEAFKARCRQQDEALGLAERFQTSLTELSSWVVDSLIDGKGLGWGCFFAEERDGNPPSVESTSVVVRALHHMKLLDDPTRLAVRRFLLSESLSPSHLWGHQGVPLLWTTVMAVWALLTIDTDRELREDRTTLEDALNFIRNDQHLASVFDIAIALYVVQLSKRRSRILSEQSTQASKSFIRCISAKLLGMRHVDVDGCVYWNGCEEEVPDPTSTALALWALASVGQLSCELKQAGVAFLKREFAPTVPYWAVLPISLVANKTLMGFSLSIPMLLMRIGVDVEEEIIKVSMQGIMARTEEKNYKNNPLVGWDFPTLNPPLRQGNWAAALPTTNYVGGKIAMTWTSAYCLQMLYMYWKRVNARAQQQATTLMASIDATTAAIHERVQPESQPTTKLSTNKRKLEQVQESQQQDKAQQQRDQKTSKRNRLTLESDKENHENILHNL